MNEYVSVASQLEIFALSDSAYLYNFCFINIQYLKFSNTYDECIHLILNKMHGQHKQMFVFRLVKSLILFLTVTLQAD